MEEKEATKCYDQMLIVEKYETVILYLYPIAQNLPQIAWFLRHKEFHKLNRFIPSWRGHAQWADTTHLFKHLENYYGITV